MNDEEKKRPGRPKKYATDAERKKAYRERKKEERQSWEKSRVKRIVELQERVGRMEKTIDKTTYDEKKIPHEQIVYLEIQEQIKARSARYTPNELTEMPLEDLVRIENALVSRYYGSYYNPIISALETAVMPSVDQEFDSRKSELGLKTPEEKLAKKLAKTKDKVTPKTDRKIEEYIQKLKEEGVELTSEDEIALRSTMEKRSDETVKRWRVLKAPYRTDQFIEVFHELMMLYNVQAEISRRERDSKLDSSIEKLEGRLENLEKAITDEKERAVKESHARRKGKKDDS
ncbi:MAG: hypothetical protein KAU62_06395 [Candidatus Heimdallarchaeota archaeon]|nr:hypothetical protein [Candidatus Heimdallarchaeota archaeon]MCG3255695.1 hypothetical protein [Candidatus Heimdallarchaeota archaeon]MCK4610769.1 hypothetical protein [Candidatus Heimdallarchaeota archaeon]